MRDGASTARRRPRVTTPVVGVVSAGHMGSGLGWALRQGGARVLTCVADRSPRTARLATSGGLELLSTMDDLLAASDVVLVVTPPGEARAAAREIMSHAPASDGTGMPVIADLNATSPSTVEDLARIYAGARFVDGSISGPPPTVRPGARIYLCGPHATEVAALPWQQYARPTVLAGPVGTASAVKMCTASVYKGLDGLLAQAIAAAAHYGVLDTVLADLGAQADPGRVAVAATKAHRYVPEMREIADAQRGAGLPPALFHGFAEVFARIAGTALAAGDPETVDRAMPPDEIAAGLRATVREAEAGQTIEAGQS